jgi:hypothetical protein
MLLGVGPLVIGDGDLGAARRDVAALGFSVAPVAALDPRLSHGARLSVG